MSNNQETVISKEECKNTLFLNLLELSEDLRTVFDEGFVSDIVLFVNGKDIKCHRAILSTRSKWFALKIRQISSSGINIIKINEKNQILDAVLLYIYTGNLKLLEALNIPLIDLRNAADKYGLPSLKKIVTDVIKSEHTADKTKSVEFQWNVKVDNHTSFISDCSALADFSLYGSDKWGLEVQPLFLGDGTCIIGVYLIRNTVNEAVKTIHFVSISVHVMNLNGSKKISFKGDLAVSEDGKFKIAEFAPDTGEKVKSDILRPDGALTLSCELSVSGKLGDSESFQLKGKYQRCISNELLILSQDMYQMLKTGKYSDSSIQIRGCVLLQVHSYILRGRIRVPISYLSKLADITGFERVVWKSFIFFLYTGQKRYLDDHMRVIYRGFNDLHLTESTLKYSKILANNMDINNALGILSDAIKSGDNDLVSSAACFLARNSISLPDPKTWISIASDTLTRESFQNGIL